MGTLTLCAEEAIPEHVASWILQPSPNESSFYVLYCPLCHCAVSDGPKEARPSLAAFSSRLRLRRLAKRVCSSCGRNLTTLAPPMTPSELCPFCKDMQKR